VFVREVFLVGVGATGFGRSGRSEEELGREAAAAALADAGLSASDVSAVSLAISGAAQRSGLPDLGLGDTHAAQLGRPTGWASRAMQMAWQAVAGGEYDVALCVGAERLALDLEPNGALAALAAAAQGYMDSSGATEAHLARVAAKNRSLGADNPRALLATRVDASAVLGSELLEWPLRRLMVAESADGAAAVVFASGAVRRRLGGHAARVRASVLLGDGDAGEAISRAAALAYQNAGLGPEDLDLAEVDDNTAAGEMAAYEALQFAPQGQGPELVESGFTRLGGVLPVNTSGGLLSQGEALGASGIAQACEIAWQLRGEAGRRQVSGARVGLALSARRAPDRLPLVSLMILSGR
jgi:acetyl-CoA acetyltransferase